MLRKILRVKRDSSEISKDKIVIDGPTNNTYSVEELTDRLNSMIIKDGSVLPPKKRHMALYKKIDTTSIVNNKDWAEKNSFMSSVAFNKSPYSTPAKSDSTPLTIHYEPEENSLIKARFISLMSALECAVDDYSNICGELLQLITTHQVDIDFRLPEEGTYHNYTLLGIAVANGRFDLALELLKLGANCTLEMTNGDSPASLFWKQMMMYGNNFSGLVEEIYHLMKKQIDDFNKKNEENQENEENQVNQVNQVNSTDPSNSTVYDYYILSNNQYDPEKDEDYISLSELYNNKNLELFNYDDLDVNLEDENEQELTDDEDSNAEGYYENMLDGSSSEDDEFLDEDGCYRNSDSLMDDDYYDHDYRPLYYGPTYDDDNDDDGDYYGSDSWYD